MDRRAHTLTCVVEDLRRRITERRNSLLTEGRDRFSFVTAIGGDATLGKTTLSAVLAAALGDASVLPLDSFIADRRVRQARGSRSGDDPDVIDFPAIADALEQLTIRRTSVEILSYDHASGEKSGTLVVAPATHLLLDGTCSLYAPINHFVDYRVALDADDSTRYLLRKRTDSGQRGYTEADFDILWHQYFLAYRDLIHPTISEADCVINASVDRLYHLPSIAVCHCD